MMMADEREDRRTPDDALLTGLYLYSEESVPPREPAYDVDAGVLRFSAWLEQKASPAPFAGEPGSAAPGSGDAVIGHGRRTDSLLARWWRRRTAFGNLLILACGADYRRVRSSADRQRYITMGALMALTTAQAFYCGANVAEMTLRQPLLRAIGYGLFLAGSVFFIDRSIVSYVAPREPGDERSRKPRHSRWAIGLRIILATAASLLLAEVLLLRVFAPRIDVQLVSDNLNAQQVAVRQIDTAYQAQIAILQAPIEAAQARVNAGQVLVNKYYENVTCQEFGCSGIPAGAGPLLHAGQMRLNTALGDLRNDQKALNAVVSANSPKIAAVQREELAAIQASARTTSESQDLLAREQAFWALTVRYPEIAFVRILLTLLLLSIDLAPVIVKVTGSYGAYEEEIRREMLLARLRTETETELLENHIHIEAEVRKARQELDRDTVLATMDSQRRQQNISASEQEQR